jgi:hypothetical protein
MKNTTFVNCCPHVIKIYDEQPKWNTFTLYQPVIIEQSHYEIRLTSKDERKQLDSLYNKYTSNKRWKKDDEMIENEEEQFKEIKVFTQQRFDNIMIYKDKKETKLTIQEFVENRDKNENIKFIVPLLVAQYIDMNYPEYNSFFYCPDTSVGAVRKDGIIEGCLNLVQFSERNIVKGSTNIEKELNNFNIVGFIGK